MCVSSAQTKQTYLFVKQSLILTFMEQTSIRYKLQNYLKKNCSKLNSTKLIPELKLLIQFKKDSNRLLILTSLLVYLLCGI